MSIFHNPFEQKVKQFDDAREVEKAKQLFEPKSPQERNRATLRGVTILIPVLHLVSAVCAAAFVYQSTLEVIAGWPFANFIAFVPTGALLVGVEYFQSVVLKAGLTGYFPKQGNYIRALSIAAVISLVSISISFLGSYDGVRLAKEAPTLVTPTLESLESIEARYEAQIAAANQAATEFKSSRTWKGRLSDKDGRTWKELKQVSIDLAQEENNAIEAARNRNQAATDQASLEYTQALEQHEASIMSAGSGLGTFAVVSQFLLWCAYGFRSWYYWMIVKVSSDPVAPNTNTAGITIPQTISQGFEPSQNTTTNAPKIGFRLTGQRNAKRGLGPVKKAYNAISSDAISSDGTVTVKTEVIKLTDNVKPCAYCGKEFVYKTKRAKYCSNKCRMDAWEVRNGKKLHRGR